MEQAKERMLAALPYLRHAVRQAKKTGKVQFGILSTSEEGSGRIIAKFDADEFFDDLEVILGAPPQSTEDQLKAEALEFAQIHGIARGVDGPSK